MTTFLVNTGFRTTCADAFLFIYDHHGIIAYFHNYVDDIVLTGNNSKFLDTSVSKLASQFSIKYLGSLHHVLGVEVISTKSGLFLSQHCHITNFLSKFNMTSAKEVTTPMATTEKYVLVDGSPNIDATSYRSLVGSLQYLSTTRPDVSFAINKLSQFIHAPTQNHMQALKRVLCYLKGTIHH